MDKRFTIVGIRPAPLPAEPPKSRRRLPPLPAVVLAIIVLGCLCCDFFLPKDPAYLDLYHANTAPNAEFWFGTDTMGRDIFSMIWHGGRLSLLIGFLSTFISTAIAVLFGTAGGIAPGWLDKLLTRVAEVFLSVPSLLLVIFLQAILGHAGVLSLSIAIGVTGWMGIAKVVRTEVRRLRESEFILAARCMGGGFFHNLWVHFLPNIFPSILFMVVMNIRGAIAAESTLSFLGLGLPLEIISWGSMLSLAERGLLSGAWWMVLIPGAFLVITLLCITELGEQLRQTADRQ